MAGFIDISGVRLYQLDLSPCSLTVRQYSILNDVPIWEEVDMSTFILHTQRLPVRLVVYGS